MYVVHDVYAMLRQWCDIELACFDVNGLQPCSTTSQGICQILHYVVQA